MKSLKETGKIGTAVGRPGKKKKKSRKLQENVLTNRTVEISLCYTKRGPVVTP